MFQRKREDLEILLLLPSTFLALSWTCSRLSWTDRIMRSIRGKRIVYGGKRLRNSIRKLDFEISRSLVSFGFIDAASTHAIL